MKKYIRASIKPERIESKKKYINQVVDKIRRGTASSEEISKACDSVVWLWKWKHIDDATKDTLCDELINAMGGIDDEADWNDESNYFRGEE